MKKPRRATEKDLGRFLRFMENWGRKINPNEGWGVFGHLCKCTKHKNCNAHMDMASTAHTADVYLHQVQDLEKTALHEQLHLQMAAMIRTSEEMIWSDSPDQREVAWDWYKYYEDIFIEDMASMILGMDKEIRSLKRKIKKLEKSG